MLSGKCGAAGGREEADLPFLCCMSGNFATRTFSVKLEGQCVIVGETLQFLQIEAWPCFGSSSVTGQVCSLNLLHLEGWQLGWRHQTHFR